MLVMLLLLLLQLVLVLGWELVLVKVVGLR